LFPKLDFSDICGDRLVENIKNLGTRGVPAAHGGFETFGRTSGSILGGSWLASSGVLPGKWLRPNF